MNRGLIILICFVIVASMACEKVVEYEPIQPKEQNYCESDPFYLGTWRTDSVWITTEVDTLDSLIFNRAPGITYLMQIDCSDTLKSLQLNYFTFAGVRTQDVLSSNFTTEDSAINVFGQLDSVRNEAELILAISNKTDSTFQAAYSRELGNGQRSDFQMFFRKN